MFHPGETVVHTFVIPFVKEDIKQIIVTYKQNDDIILERVIASSDSTNFDLAFSPSDNLDEGESRFFVQLTQPESLQFQDFVDTNVQLNVLTRSGGRFTSRPMLIRSGEQQHREVISNV